MGKHKRYETVKILLDTSRTISSTLDLDKVVDLILKESMDALRVDHASLFLIDILSRKLMLMKADGFSEDEIDNIKILGSWEAVNDQLIKKKRPLVVNDIQRDPAFSRKNLPFLRERLPISSFLAVPLKREDSPEIIGVLIVSNRKRPGYRFTKDDVDLLVALSNYISIALLNAKLYDTLKNLFISTVKSLITAVDAKDRYTSGHSERVMKYAVAIGKAIGMKEEPLENLRMSSLLHDIGKIGVTDAVLLKPIRLEASETRLVRHHPLIGAHIIESIDSEHRITKGIVQHHEWFNGKGYPSGLKGAQISPEGRVIAVADAYDALTTKRPYKRAFSPKGALFEIKKSSGRQFDPKVVKAFILSFSKHPSIWQA